MGRTVLLRSSAFAAVAAAVMSSPVLAQPAAGQPPPENEADPTESDTVAAGEIVVTAQFREQRLQDTPLAITAVNAAQIEAKSQTNLAQVADTAPNVTIRPQNSAFGPSVSASIRGIGQNDFNPAFEPGVGLYIDDVYYPQLTGALFDVLDLERVEILRGPQGTLSGRNSLGGAIKLYSKKPNGDSSGFLEAAYGSRDRLSLRGAADFALTETLFARVAGVSKSQDGYVEQLDFGCVYPAGGSATFVDAAGVTRPVNPAGGVAARTHTDDCKVGDLSGIGYQAVRGSLRWVPSGDLEVNLIADYTHDEHTITGEVLLATATLTNPNVRPAPGVNYDNRFICGRFCNFMNMGNPAANFIATIPGDPARANGTPLAETSGDNRSRYEGWGISGQIDYDVSDRLQIVSITGYREFDTRFIASAGLSPASINFGINDLTNWSVSQELRLNAEIGDTIFATLGGYYFKQKSVYDSIQDIRYVAPNPLQFRQPDPTEAEAKAAFANVAWEALPDLNVTAGVRYTDENKQQTYYRLNLDGTINRFLDPVGAAYGSGYSGPDTLDSDRDGNTAEVVTALTGFTAEYQADRLDWRVSVDYRFIPEIMVYATVATGFMGGGSNPRPFNAAQVISFNPQEVVSYEAGLKSDFFGRRLRLNLAAFYNDFKDIQLTVSQCPTAPCAARLNAGDAKVRGFEAELSAEPIENLAIDASLSYIDFQYKEGSLNPLAAAPPVGINPGGVLPSDPATVPPWKASIGAQYRIELGSAGSLTPRADVVWQDDQYTGSVVLAGVRTRNFIDSYALVNARLTWRNADEDLQVALEVTNLTDQYYYLSTFDQRGAGAGFRVGQPGRPREWAVSVKKQF